MQQYTTYDPILRSETQQADTATGHADLSCKNYTGTSQVQSPVYGFRELAPGMSLNNTSITTDSSEVTFNPYIPPAIIS